MKGFKKFFVTLLLLATAVSACAGEPSVADKLKKVYPKLQFQNISPSPIQGLYEVTAGDLVIYFDPVSGHTIFGEMWSPLGIDVTASAKEKISSTKYEAIKKNLSAAIKIGNGPNEVIEITDPDCPFCRRMYKYWGKRSDVTRYVFLMPVTQLHPKAKAHSDYILSATDSIKALDEVETGKFDQASMPTTVLNEARIKAQAAALVSGINATPAYFINGAFVMGANEPLIEKHLKGGKSEK